MDTDRKLREAYKSMKETENNIKTILEEKIEAEDLNEVLLHLAFMQGDIINLIRIQ